jgi:hypothetical protein
MSTADQQRVWRAKQGARTGQLGRPVTQPCGTTAAYKRHQRHGDEPCGACRVAWAEYQRGLYVKRKGKMGP